MNIGKEWGNLKLVDSFLGIRKSINIQNKDWSNMSTLIFVPI